MLKSALPATGCATILHHSHCGAGQLSPWALPVMPTVCEILQKPLSDPRGSQHKSGFCSCKAGPAFSLQASTKGKTPATKTPASRPLAAGTPASSARRSLSVAERGRLQSSLEQPTPVAEVAGETCLAPGWADAPWGQGRSARCMTGSHFLWHRSDRRVAGQVVQEQPLCVWQCDH